MFAETNGPTGKAQYDRQTGWHLVTAIVVDSPNSQGLTLEYHRTNNTEFEATYRQIASSFAIDRKPSQPMSQSKSHESCWNLASDRSPIFTSRGSAPQPIQP